MLTLGCARNEVDSEELAARLAADGWQLTDDGAEADVVLVNTCGFVEQAKQDSIDTLLAAGGGGAKVVAAGCMAERYGRELADNLPEADAVLGFDDYPQISARLNSVLAGEQLSAHTPRDRRTLLPITPVERHVNPAAVPGHGDNRGIEVDERTPAHLKVLRYRLDSGPVASLKLASGCDRRCSFCAIPSFRGAYLSRPAADILAEARWLADQGVRELVLVSENSSSYGKDLGDPRLLEKLLPRLAAVPGIVRVRVSYLQPAEMRPELIKVIADTPGLAPYFDLSFQHSSESVLRRMRRFGSTERFWQLLETARGYTPELGARTNVIVGFPGETAEDFAELERFLTGAELDAIGVFGYSDEDGTEAVGLPDKVPAEQVEARVARLSSLVDELVAQRAEDRVGSTVEVLVDSVDGDVVEGRAAHQAPEVDGSTTLIAGGALDLTALQPGDLVLARVDDSVGVDLVAVPEQMIDAAPRQKSQLTGAARGGPR